MSRSGLARTLERLEARLLPAATIEGALARREAGVTAADDGDLLRERLAAIVAAQDAEGGWHGSLADTGRALLELAELAEALPEANVAAGRALAAGEGGATEPRGLELAVSSGTIPALVVSGALSWLRLLRGGRGRFGDSCDPAWHQAGLCEHTLSYFHAPVPPRDAPPDTDALVVDSARATRAALRWGETGTRLDRHLDGLRRVVSHWAWPEGEALVKGVAAMAALEALLQGPATPVNVRAIAEGLACLLRSQRADGTWHGVPLYDALELLLAGVARGYDVPEVDAALARGAQLLMLTQKTDGSWGAGTGPREPLIAWRVLRHALGVTAGEPAPA